jgi:hypothetical protein
MSINIKWLLGIIIAFLAPIKALIIIVGVSIFLDTIMGILRSIKQGHKFTSNRLSRVVSKMFLYQVVVILFFSIEKYILADFILSFTTVELFLTKLVTFGLISIEIISINENYEIISGVNIFNKIKSNLKRGADLKNKVKDSI